MKRVIAGYVGTIGGVVLALLTLASLGQATTNYVATAFLIVMTISMLGVGWYGLLVERAVDESLDEAPAKEKKQLAAQREAA
jgi:hypothetical protein